MSTDDIIIAVNKIIAKYSEDLLQNGVKCAIHKKRFQHHTPHEPHTPTNSGLFFLIDKAIYKFRLRFLPFKDDDYNCIVIKFEPTNTTLKMANTKEYAFIASYREDFKNRKYSSSKIPEKAEKLIKKIIKKLRKTSADKVCKDTVFDILRYTTQVKYIYKKHILGYDRNILDTAVSLFFILVLVLLVVILFSFL